MTRRSPRIAPNSTLRDHDGSRADETFLPHDYNHETIMGYLGKLEASKDYLKIGGSYL